MQGAVAMGRCLNAFSVKLLLGTVFVASSSAFGAQMTRCGSLELKSALRPANSAYADATELTRVLQAHGVVVECVLNSKSWSRFEGQEGAAFFRTDQGDFDALFLPKTKTWDSLKIIQTENDGRYLTSFQGWPSGSPMNGSRPSYFVKHANVLCSTGDDEQLSTKLNQLLNLDEHVVR
jgi:hypothetical protein